MTSPLAATPATPSDASQPRRAESQRQRLDATAAPDATRSDASHRRPATPRTAATDGAAGSATGKLQLWRLTKRAFGPSATRQSYRWLPSRSSASPAIVASLTEPRLRHLVFRIF